MQPLSICSQRKALDNYPVLYLSAPVAQLAEATVYQTAKWEFESPPGHQ